LVSDAGFDGLVIKNEIIGITFHTEINSVTVGAGENWDAFVATMVSGGYAGFENLSYIPGTVGAAPVQNIGAYGAEVKDMIISVEALDVSKNMVVQFLAKDCCFGYRDSVFKQNPGKYIITNVTFKLVKAQITGGGVNIAYKDLANYFNNKNMSVADGKTATQLTPADVRKAVIEIRKNKLPDWTKIGTAGSFFKNPVINRDHFEMLKKKYPDLPSFETRNSESVKIPLAWILDNVCGYKGRKYTGAVGVYQNQALVLVNDYMTDPSAKAVDIKKLADDIIETVAKKTDIHIEPEVQYIGAF
jgi:UDP-N-acetylmuramate dehydrogenase